MGFEKILLDKYGIKNGDSLFDVEYRLMKLFSRVMEEPVKADVVLLKEDIRELDSEIADYSKEFVKLTGMDVDTLRYSSRLLAWFITQNTDLSLLKNRFSRGSYSISRHNLKLVVASDESLLVRKVAELIINIRIKEEKRKVLKNFLSRCNGNDTFLATHSGVASSSGMIISSGPNLGNPYLHKYILLDSSKRVVFVGFKDVLLYFISNILNSDMLRHFESIDNGVAYLAAFLHGSDDLSAEYTRNLKHFVLSNLFQEFSSSSDDFKTISGTNSEVNLILSALYDLSNVSPKTYTTFYGRRLKNARLGQYINGLHADLLKLVIIRLQEDVPYLNFKFCLRGGIVFEIDKSYSLEDIRFKVKDVFNSFTPENWSHPSLYMVSSEGGTLSELLSK